MREMLRTALLIRCFEEKVLTLFGAGEVSGTVHTCIGQEWSAVAVCNALQPGDGVFSNHRGHGHYLAHCGDVDGLLAEVMGRDSGACGGIGGSQHLHGNGFYSNGVQGGMAPVAAGFALARKRRGKDDIACLFVGDGTLGEGVLYETLNIASKWELPLLVVVENNAIAQTTPIERTLAGSVAGRAAAFGIEFGRQDSRRWEELAESLTEIVDTIRREKRPFLLEIETYRLQAHSKGDDTRDPERIAQLHEADPLNRLMKEQAAELAPLLEEVHTQIERAYLAAKRSAYPGPAAKEVVSRERPEWVPKEFESKRIVELLNGAFHDVMRADADVVFVGEDVLSPYGGAFKVAADLSVKFPDRVYDTPISESAIAGISWGLALGGCLPVAEIMFGDFLGLCFDQIVNHGAKFAYMYNGRVSVPAIIRTPMGGRRGYGPTHSQSIEKHFLGIPHLSVLALNVRVCPAFVYKNLIKSIDSPVLVIENKVLYTRFLRTETPPGFRALYTNELFPTVRLSPEEALADVTIFCYGGMLEEVESAMEILFDEHDILAEVICPTRIHPLDIQPVKESVEKTHALVTVEEGAGFAALGAEVIAQLAQAGAPLGRVRRVAYDGFIPTCAELEKRLLPSAETIVAAVKELCDV